MKRLWLKTAVMSAGTLLTGQMALASTPWIGMADYTLATGSQADEATVGPFDTYDFGAGIGLVKPDTTVAAGNTFTGTFQTMVNSHMLNGQGINVGQLDTSGGTAFSGSGNGFELTLVSEFTGQYTAVNGNALDIALTGGSATLYFHSDPNYSFKNDLGFADGTPILSGTILAGIGTIIYPTTIGIGVEQVELDFSGAFGSFDTAVYEPDTINGGSALFSVKAKTPLTITPIIDQVTGIGGANSVFGVSAVGSQLFELDGKMQLTAVPLPATAWIFLSGMMGFLSFIKRSRRPT